MSLSKEWNWSIVQDPMWLQPSEESYYLAQRWRDAGYRTFLDFGCGLGRHAIFFARKGFSVSAFDLSSDGVAHLHTWAAQEKLNIDTRVADMLNLPYADNTFDCLLAYHVISHTDTAGMRKVIAEIGRVLRPHGEFYVTLCSKETWSFSQAGFPKVDDNTVLKTCDGPEQGIPHFYAGLDDILGMFRQFNLRGIRHVDDCSPNGLKHSSKHYFVLGQKP